MNAIRQTLANCARLAHPYVVLLLRSIGPEVAWMRRYIVANHAPSIDVPTVAGEVAKMRDE